MKFSELHLNGNVLEALDAMRFEECTPIQEQSIPVILVGQYLIAVAQTGTGKTAAYLLPILNKLSEGGHPADAINCIVMAPTRELAQQIDQQMEGFSYFMPASSVAVYGGNDGIRFEQQKKGLTLGADVVIATPGRLISHLSLGYVDLSKVSFFILDEADRMLDMGFADQDPATGQNNSDQSGRSQTGCIQTGRENHTGSLHLLRSTEAGNYRITLQRAATGTCHHLCILQNQGQGSNQSA